MQKLLKTEPVAFFASHTEHIELWWFAPKVNAFERNRQMTEQVANDSTAPSEYLDHIFEVMRGNHEFLELNAKAALDEVLDLMNDAVDQLGLFGTGSESIHEIGRHAMG